ncbi:MAG: methyltransferase domain-containing protein [Anaerolineae bacterium]|nr:methyltransferase domain-containing protein [Anaerolineae bacterium]
MQSLTSTISDNVAWYRQIAAGWARRMIAGDAPGAWASNTDTEVQFARAYLDLHPGDHLLDLGCGWGRHSLPLAAYGVQVTGVDVSHELLTLARHNARRHDLTVRWVEADIARLPLRGTFDAVAQFCDNFLAWFADREQARAALWNVAHMLRPGGRLLIGKNDWQPDLPSREQKWDEWRGGAAIHRHRYDQRQRIAHSQTVVFGPEHERREFNRRRWWPARQDIEALFAEVGLTVVQRTNTYVDAPFNPEQRGLVYVLVRD